MFEQSICSAHLPQKKEEPGWVVANGQPQALRVVVLEDLQGLSPHSGGCGVFARIPLEICRAGASGRPTSPFTG